MKKNILLLTVLLTVFSGCEEPLQEEVYSSLGPSNFYQSAEDAESLLNAAYAQCQGYRDVVRDFLCLGEVSTEIFIEREGGINTWFRPMEEFSWDAAHAYLDLQWTRWYRGIYNANTVIDNVPNIEMNEERKEQIVVEARFLRAVCYYWLYDYWGPVPLILTSGTTPQDRPSRPTDEEFVTFLEDEFIALGEILPQVQEEYPRATSGAALGFLTKFYMNNHKWSLGAATAKTIMDSNIYDLFVPDNSRAELFYLENEGDNEFIWVLPFSSQNVINSYNSHAVPDNFTWKYNTLTNFAADFLVPTSFINTFDSADNRLDAFIFQYETPEGDTIVLGEDRIASFKFPEDPNQVGDQTSIDFPVIRYADILLLRAEALNELNGPTQESIDLINQVRTLAGVSDLVLADYTQQTLRDAIMQERAWEFHTEGFRRQDLIRQGRFISDAVARGWPAKDYQVLYPIPQTEIDVNSNLEQNPGY